MKVALLLLFSISFCFSPASSNAAVWVSNFTKSPYTLGETVVGEGGWAEVSFGSEKQTDAAIVTDPLGGEGQVLRLLSTSTGASGTRTSVINNQTAVMTTPLIEVHLQMGWYSHGSTTSASGGIRFGGSTNPGVNVPTALLFARTKGIYVLSHNGTSAVEIQLLDWDQMIDGYLYDFVFTFDATTKTFDVRMTGLDRDQNPIDTEESFYNLSYQTPSKAATGINGLRLEAYRADLTNVYVGSISMKAIPEPGSLALGLFSGAGLLGLLRHRSRKARSALR